MPLPPNRVVDGDSQLRGGLNSINPLDLSEGYYLRSVNMLNRGGGLQTRPGFRWVDTLPDGALQGFTIFRPRGGVPQLIAAISGRIYRSIFPYSDGFTMLENILLSDTAEKVWFAQATKSVSRNDDNSIAFIDPVNALIIQDYVNAPGFYDGRTNGQLRGSVTTPVGGPMAWTGDRLWVANGARIYVSDISDPYSFQEQTYNTLGGKQYFQVEEEVTAMAETPGLEAPQLLVFTDVRTVAFQSNVRERSTWPTLPDFQKTIFPTVGCMSQRSIVAQHGLLWWLSPFGLVSLDATVASRQTSVLHYQDNEMAFSKARLDSDLSGVAGASFENYLLLSVPYSDQRNAHTWVLDFTIRDTIAGASNSAWASVWTGIRPVEWATANVQGVPRIFCASVDYDGHNRVWEAFGPNRRDEFCDIDWAFETRAYTAQTLSPKEFRMAELALSDLAGAVDLTVQYAGVNKGRWNEIANSRIHADEGNIHAGQPVPEKLFALKKQYRLYRTQDARDMAPKGLASCGVESDKIDRRDTAFQLCVKGSGPCAVRAIRVFLDQVNEDNDGKCTPTEDPGRFVRMDGAAARDEDDLQVDFRPAYTGQAEATFSYGGVTVIADAEAVSVLSQAAADKLALQRAQADANDQLVADAPPFVGGGVEEEAPFTGSLDFEDPMNSDYCLLL